MLQQQPKSQHLTASGVPCQPLLEPLPTAVIHRSSLGKLLHSLPDSEMQFTSWLPPQELLCLFSEILTGLDLYGQGGSHECGLSSVCWHLPRGGCRVRLVVSLSTAAFREGIMKSWGHYEDWGYWTGSWSWLKDRPSCMVPVT